MSVRRAVAGAALLFALNALGQVSETITVEVVEVPVYVTAADGTPIRGLAKDAFTLFVNGKPKPIDYFEEVDFHGGQALLPVPAAQGQARVPALHERRLYLLLFDLAFSRPGLIERAHRAAHAEVVRSNPATDYFAVATFTRGGGVRFVVPFLNDYVAVRRAIATLQSNDAKDPLGVGLTAKQRQRWAQIEGRAAGVPLAIGFRTGDPEIDSMIAGSEVNMELARQIERDDINGELAGLGTVAARLAALEGQKHVVIFSAGFDSTMFINLGKGYSEDPQMHRYLREMVHAFRGAGAFLDSIDIVGNRPAEASPHRDLDPLQLADIVINDIPQNGLSLRLETSPKQIAILFRPPEVVAQLLPDKPYVEAMLYVFDEHGGPLLFRSKRLPFNARAPKVGVAGVREAVSLPKGRYVVKALMHVAGTQSVGFARGGLVVP